MRENRIADPELLAIEAIRSNPKGAADRMKADQEKVVSLKAELDILREIAKKHLVKIHVYPASGDCPESHGYITEANGKFDSAHVSKDDALNHFIEQVLREQEEGGKDAR